MKRSPFTAAILLGLVTGVSAQTPASTPRPESATSAPAAELSSTDRAFITKAAEGGKAEIEFGQLAQQKASTDEVKALGKRIADDHQRANRDLETMPDKSTSPSPSSLSTGAFGPESEARIRQWRRVRSPVRRRDDRGPQARHRRVREGRVGCSRCGRQGIREQDVTDVAGTPSPGRSRRRQVATPERVIRAPAAHPARPSRRTKRIDLTTRNIDVLCRRNKLECWRWTMTSRRPSGCSSSSRAAATR